jgi:hypothetical protein
VLVTGRLERRAGVINLVARELHALERPDLPRADVKHIEPPVPRETGRDAQTEAEPGLAAAAAGDLRAVVPVGQYFGRRGR